MGTILVFNVVRYICLKDRGGKRELFCLLICSPNGCGSRDSARPKPGAECFFEISVAGAILWRFCSSISREQLGLKLMGCWLHRRQLYPLCQRQSLTFLPIKIWEVESQRGGRKADMSSLFSVFPHGLGANQCKPAIPTRGYLPQHSTKRLKWIRLLQGLVLQGHK